MHLLRFKCKVTGRTFQEITTKTLGCNECAFQCSKTELEGLDVCAALGAHCLNVKCIPRQTAFVEVKE